LALACGLALWVGAGRACEGLSVGWVRAWLPMGHTCQVAERKPSLSHIDARKLHANPRFLAVFCSDYIEREGSWQFLSFSGINRRPKHWYRFARNCQKRGRETKQLSTF